jgi:hypothetical protein
VGVTATTVVVAPAAKVAVAGTVATAVLSDARFTVNPPVGAGTERLRFIFCAAEPVMVRVG